MAQVVTNEDGRFQLFGLREGQYNLVLLSPGIKQIQLRFNLDRNAEDLRIRLRLPEGFGK